MLVEIWPGEWADPRDIRRVHRDRLWPHFGAARSYRVIVRFWSTRPRYVVRLTQDEAIADAARIAKLVNEALGRGDQ